MSWSVQFKRAFLRDLSRLPNNFRIRAEEIAFGDQIKVDPFLNGRTQKMSGFNSFYKIRVGNYRIGVKLDFDNETVEFRRVLHRREIYRRFP